MKAQMVALGDLYQIGSSKRVLKSQWKTEGVPFYRGREITRLAADGFVENELFISEEHFAELAAQSGVPKTGDIVITAIGTIGNAHIVRDFDRFYFKDASVLWMKKTSDVSSEFINLWLKSPLFFDQLDRGNGATVDTLTIQKLQSVRLCVPSPAEQQRIVALLDEAFAGIATARAAAEQNRQNARALFASHLQSVFSQRGEGWVLASLGDVCEFENGDRGKNYPNRSEYVDSGVPWINTGHIQPDGTLSETEMNYLTKEKFDSLRSGKIRPGDLVYCLRGATLGKTALVAPLTVGAVASSLVILRPSKSLTSRFLYYFLTSPVGQGLIKAYENGAAQPNLGAKSVAKYEIAFPDFLGQEHVVSALDTLAAETQRLESLYQRKLAALDELKQSLLHQAFSGQL